MSLKAIDDYFFSIGTISKRKDIQLVGEPSVEFKSCLTTLQSSALQERSVFRKFGNLSLLLSSIVLTEAVCILTILPLSLKHHLLGTVDDVIEGLFIKSLLSGLDCITGYNAWFLFVSCFAFIEKNIHRDFTWSCFTVAICKSSLGQIFSQRVLNIV